MPVNGVAQVQSSMSQLGQPYWPVRKPSTVVLKLDDGPRLSEKLLAMPVASLYVGCANATVMATPDVPLKAATLVMLTLAMLCSSNIM